MLLTLNCSSDKGHTKLMLKGTVRGLSTCRIIPVSKWLVTAVYKPFKPFGRGTTLLWGLTNHFTISKEIEGFNRDTTKQTPLYMLYTYLYIYTLLYIKQDSQGRHHFLLPIDFIFIQGRISQGFHPSIHPSLTFSVFLFGHKVLKKGQYPLCFGRFLGLNLAPQLVGK